MKIGREYTNRVILNDIYTSHIELLLTKLILIIHPFKIKFFSSNSFFSQYIYFDAKIEPLYSESLKISEEER